MLVNPAVVAHLSLQNYIGPQRWLYTGESFDFTLEHVEQLRAIAVPVLARPCLLYTSDAADERSSVDLGGRRIIQKKKADENVRGEQITKKNKHS